MSAFRSLKGQEYARRVLSASAQQGRPASSYLFYGPNGVGKFTAARCLAQALFCQELPGQGCSHCGVCRRLAEGKHPDLLSFKPQGLSFKIEQVREILKEAGMRPYEAPRRVIVIENAEELTDSAGNALLKVIEEPGPSLLFVLLSSARARLLPTIASRCQAVRFSSLPEAAMISLLTQTRGLSEKEARELAALSGGSMDRARQFLDEEGRDSRAMAESFLEAAASRSLVKRLSWAQSLASDRAHAEEVLDLLAALLRDLWVESSGIKEAGRLMPGSMEHGKSLSKERLEGLLDGVTRASNMLRRNVQVGLALEDFAANAAA